MEDLSLQEIDQGGMYLRERPWLMRITKSPVSKAVMILIEWKKDVGLSGLICFSLTIYAESVADIWSCCQSERAGGDQVRPSLHDPIVCLRDISIQVVRRLDCNSYPT